jgi:hypothetical protein
MKYPKRPNVYVNVSRIHGKGLFIGQKVPANTNILLIADLERKHEGLRWITRHGALINHQKNANCILKQNGSYFFLFSNRFIHKGEELTLDYSILPNCFNRKIEGYTEL